MKKFLLYLLLCYAKVKWGKKMSEKNVVGIYCRVSTQEQAREGYSIGEQEDRLRAWCTAKDWFVYDAYIDAGFSGASTDRPALKRMITDIRNRKINTVLVYKLDRLSRSQKDTLHLIEDIFIKQNITFASMTENLDTSTAFGRAMIGILSAFAQLEREQIRERSILGRTARAKDGYFHGGGYSPIGYRYEDGNLVQDKYEVMQIRAIYELYVTEKKPINQIKNKINTMGYRHSNGKKWTDTSVRSCLFTPIYAGWITNRGDLYRGKHEPIYTEDEYAAIMREKERRAPEPTTLNAFKHTSILGGLIFCGKCGARYFVKQNTRRKCDGMPQRYYTCYTRGKTSKKMMKADNCDAPTFRVEKLDKIILDEIQKLSFDHDLIPAMMDENQPPSPSEQRQQLEKRITEIDDQISKWGELFATGKMNMSITLDNLNRLNEERDSISAQMDNLETVKPPDVDCEQAISIADMIAEKIKRADTEDLNILVSTLIEKIVIFDDTIKIHWNFV